MRIGDMMKFGTGNLGTGIAVGAGITLLTPIVYPLVGGLLKGVTKGIIKAGILAYDGGKSLVNSSAATLEGLAAEAKAELKGSTTSSAPKPKIKTAKPAKKAKPAQKAKSTQKAKPAQKVKSQAKKSTKA
jgi:hypothetical protein